MNIIKGDAESISVAASSFAVLSKQWQRETDQIRLGIFLSSLSLSNAITFKLQYNLGSKKGGEQLWFDVGSEAQVSAAAAKTFDASAGVNTGTEAITSTGHGFETGDPVILDDDGNTLPTGISDGETYFAIKVDANTLKLAATQKDAYEGTAVNLTAAGSGTCNIWQAWYEIRMVPNDSSDYAQLPLSGALRLVATSGASDTCTVVGVLI